MPPISVLRSKYSGAADQVTAARNLPSTASETEQAAAARTLLRLSPIGLNSIDGSVLHPQRKPLSGFDYYAKMKTAWDKGMHTLLPASAQEWVALPGDEAARAQFAREKLGKWEGTVAPAAGKLVADQFQFNENEIPDDIAPEDRLLIARFKAFANRPIGQAVPAADYYDQQFDPAEQADPKPRIAAPTEEESKRLDALRDRIANRRLIARYDNKMRAESIALAYMGVKDRLSPQAQALFKAVVKRSAIPKSWEPQAPPLLTRLARIPMAGIPARIYEAFQPDTRHPAELADTFAALPLQERQILSSLVYDARADSKDGWLKTAGRQFLDMAAKIPDEASEKLITDTVRRTIMSDEEWNDYAQTRAQLEDVVAYKPQDFGYFGNSMLGVVSTLPYMGYAMIPYAGAVMIAGQATAQFERRVAAEGGDTSSLGFQAASYAGGIAYAAIERMQAARLVTLPSAMQKRALLFRTWQSASKSLKALGNVGGDAGAEIAQEMAQKAVEDGFVAWGLDRNIAREATEGAVQEFKDSGLTMLALSAGGLAGRGIAVNTVKRLSPEEQLASHIHMGKLLSKLGKGDLSDKAIQEDRNAVGELRDLWFRAGNRERGVQALKGVGFSDKTANLYADMFQAEYRAVMEDAKLTPVQKRRLIGQETDPRAWLVRAMPDAELTENPDGGFSFARATKGTRTTVNVVFRAAGELDMESPQAAASIVSTIQSAGGKPMTADEWLALSPEKKKELADHHELHKNGWFEPVDRKNGVTEGSLNVLAGTIHLDQAAHPATLFHEYFHGFTRMLRDSGVMSEADIAKAREEFGAPAVTGEEFNEETAANAFQGFVAGKVNPPSSSILRHLWNALATFLNAIRGAKARAAESATIRESMLEQALAGNFSGIPVATVASTQAARQPAQAAEPAGVGVKVEPVAVPATPRYKPGDAVTGTHTDPDGTVKKGSLGTVDEVVPGADGSFSYKVRWENGKSSVKPESFFFEEPTAPAPPLRLPEPPVLPLTHRTTGRPPGANQTPSPAQPAAAGISFASVQDKAAREEAGKVAAIRGETGRWESTTPDGSIKVSGYWAVMPLDGPITSDMPGYDGRLQGRSRENVASRIQIAKIARNPQPARLFESPETDGGAPILTRSLNVLSGNGRLLGLRQALELGNLADYDRWVRAKAGELGIDIPANIDHPVLVRIIDSTDEQAALERVAELSNRSRVLARGPAETAEADAQTILKGNLLPLYAPDAAGNVFAASNREFMAAFVRAVNDDSLIDSDGNATDAAGDRVRRAMLAIIAGRGPDARNVIRAFVEESRAVGMSRVVDGAAKAAGDLVALADLKPQFSLLDELALALREFMQFKLDGAVSAREWVGQQALFGPARPAIIDKLIVQMADRGNIYGLLQAYVEKARKIDTTTGDMFGAAPTDKEAVLDLAIRDTAEPAARFSVRANRLPYDQLAQAFNDWTSKRAYLDNSGNYRLRDMVEVAGFMVPDRNKGKIAPWNAAVKGAFPDSAAFHSAAQKGEIPQTLFRFSVSARKNLAPASADVIEKQYERAEREARGRFAEGETQEPATYAGKPTPSASTNPGYREFRKRHLDLAHRRTSGKAAVQAQVDRLKSDPNADPKIRAAWARVQYSYSFAESGDFDDLLVQADALDVELVPIHSPGFLNYREGDRLFVSEYEGGLLELQKIAFQKALSSGNPRAAELLAQVNTASPAFQKFHETYTAIRRELGRPTTRPADTARELAAQFFAVDADAAAPLTLQDQTPAPIGGVFQDLDAAEAAVLGLLDDLSMGEVSIQQAFRFSVSASLHLDRPVSERMPEAVISHTAVYALRSHPDFERAKKHQDGPAAARIVRTFVKPEGIEALRKTLTPERKLFVVPIVASENHPSLNAIPIMFASYIARRLGGEVWDGLVKATGLPNTDATAVDRFANEQTFQGDPPPADSDVILVDDTFTSGKTLMDLQFAVGRKPNAVTTLSSGRYGNGLIPNAENVRLMLEKGRVSHAEFVNLLGFQPGALTDAQVRQYLFNGARGPAGLLARFSSPASSAGAQRRASGVRSSGQAEFDFPGEAHQGLTESIAPDIRYSVSAQEAKDWNVSLNLYLSSALDTSKPVTVLNGTPQILQACGAADLPITITKTALDHSTKGKTPDDHLVPVKELRKLPFVLDDPIAVFQSRTEPDAIVLLTEIIEDNEHAVVAIHLDKQEGRIAVNSIRSIYGRPEQDAAGWMRSGLALYVHTQKIRAVFQSIGVQFPKEGSRRGKLLTEQDFTVPPSDDPVNPPRQAYSASRGKYSYESMLVAGAAARVLAGKDVKAEDYARFAQFLDVPITGAQIVERAKARADSEEGKAAREALYSQDPAAALDIMAKAEESTALRRAVRKGAAAYASLSDIGKKADEAGMKALLASVRGEDLQAFTVDTGIDLTATLLNAAPEAFDDRPDSPGTATVQPGMPAQPAADREVTPEELADRSARAANLIDLVREWWAQARARRAKRAEERAAILAAGGFLSDEQADQEQEDDSTIAAIPRALLEAAKVNLNSSQEVAHLFRVWVGQWMIEHSNGRITPKNVWSDPEAREKYRKTVVQQLQDMADKLLEPADRALSNIKQRIGEIDSSLSVSQVESMSAYIIAAIQRNAIRQKRATLTDNLAAKIRKLAVDGREFDPTKSDIRRKVSAEVERVARMLAKIIYYTDRKAAAEADRITEEMKKREQAVADSHNPDADINADEKHNLLLLELQLINRWAGLKYRMPGEIAKADAEIVDWLSGEKARLTERLEQRADLVALHRANLVAAISRDPAKHARPESESTLAAVLDSFQATVRSRLMDAVRYSTGEVREKALESIEFICFEIGEAEQTYGKLTAEYRLQEDRMFHDVADGQTAQYQRHLDEPIPEDASRQLLTSSEQGRQTMSYSQAIRLYLMLAQTDSVDAITENGRGGQVQLLEHVLTAQDLQLVNRIRQLYASRREALSVAAVENTGLPVYSPDPNYAPKKKWMGDRAGLGTKARAWTPWAKELTPRVKNRRDFDESADLDSMFRDSDESAIRSIAFGGRGSVVRDILASKDVKGAMTRFHGAAKTHRLMEQLLDTFLGVESQSGAEARIARTAMTVTALTSLSYNPGSVIKQVFAIPAWAQVLEGEYRDVWRYLWDFDIDTAKQLMNTDGFRARYGYGMSPEYAQINRDRRSGGRIARFYAFGMKGIERGDMIASLSVGVGLYKAKLKQHLDENMPLEAARHRAATEMWNKVEESQQSARASNLAPAIRGSYKIFFQFQSPQMLQYSHLAEAARTWRARVDPDGSLNIVQAIAQSRRNAAAGIDDGRATLVRRIFLNHVLLPLLMQSVNVSIRALIGDDDDPDEIAKETLLAMLLGPVSHLFLVGAILTAAGRGILGLRQWGSGMPAGEKPLRIAKEATDVLRDLSSPEDFDPEKLQKDILDLLAQMGAPFRIPIKFIRNQAED